MKFNEKKFEQMAHGPLKDVTVEPGLPFLLEKMQENKSAGIAGI